VSRLFEVRTIDFSIFGLMRKYRFKLFISFSLLLPLLLVAQVGGTHTYAFLDLTNSARIASLGGKMVPIYDDDLNLPYFNPSLLNPQMDNHVVLNYVNYFADIYYGYACYAHSYPGIGTFAAGIHYINYGSFIAADETGLITGSFKASEYAVNLMYSREIDSSFTVGITLKPIYSSLENYQSYGLATDLGLSYHSTNQLFVASLVLRNIGFQLRSYYNSTQEPMPFEIEVGVSQRLQFAPFRFMLTLQQLQKPDLTYAKPENQQKIDPVTGLPVQDGALAVFSDKVLRHMIFGLEFIPIRSFYFRAGLNYERRKELMIDTRPGTVGFSWGFGLNISKFQLSYGRATYHLAGASNHFSISVNLSELIKRKEVEE
jgi:hypothetical protein